MRTGIKGGQLKVLSEEQVHDIHLATLNLLKAHGVEIRHEGILKMLADAGADVDFRRQVVLFPEYLVEESIRKAPKSIRCCGRDPNEDFLLEGSKTYFGPCSGSVYFIDLETGAKRRGRLSDVKTVARVCDFLENIDFVMGLTSPSDVPSKVVGLYEQYGVMTATRKHTLLYAYHGAELTRVMIKIAQLLAGGERELRRRPLASLYAEPLSPLIFGREYVEALMEWSKAGLPLIWAPCPMCGGTAPITLAGMAVQGSAESLAGNVICQLISPGTPFVFGYVPIVMDMRRAVASYGSAESMLMEIILAQISHYYQLPSWGTGGITDSKTLDEQAISEATMNLMTAALSGNNLIHDIGFMEAAKIGSLDLIVICDELIAMLQRVMSGVNVNPETLATEAIKEAGHGGSFLGIGHTLRYFASEHWMPEMMDRSSWDRWTREGRKTLGQRANERIERILKEAEVQPVPREIEGEIIEIIKDWTNKF